MDYDESIKNLSRELQELRTENLGLRDQVDSLTRKLSTRKSDSQSQSPQIVQTSPGISATDLYNILQDNTAKTEERMLKFTDRVMSAVQSSQEFFFKGITESEKIRQKVRDEILDEMELDSDDGLSGIDRLVEAGERVVERYMNKPNGSAGAPQVVYQDPRYADLMNSEPTQTQQAPTLPDGLGYDFGEE